MNKITLKALQKSIKHWNNIVNGTAAYSGRKGCALCDIFYPYDNKDKPIAKVHCWGCPIAFTGFDADSGFPTWDDDCCHKEPLRELQFGCPEEDFELVAMAQLLSLMLLLPDGVEPSV